MLGPVRRELILKKLEDEKFVKVSTLSAEFHVTEVTIRRDLDVLDENNVLRKIRGGAVALEIGKGFEANFEDLELSFQSEKQDIAQCASKLVAPFQTVALMGGSTVALLARALVKVPSLTVMTNSLPISNFFHQFGRADLNLVLSGGQRTRTDALVGAVTDEFFSQFTFDLAFLGTQRMEVDSGFSSPNFSEARTNRLLMKRSRKVVILADHSKWGSQGFASFGKLGDADTLITDQGMPPAVVELLRAHVAEVLLAES